MTSRDAATARAARAWTAFLNAFCVLLLWRYVDPWAAWGYTVFLFVLALAFDFWPTAPQGGPDVSLARLRELKYAEAAFFVASVAVWREVDERDARPGGYSAAVLTKDTDLRVAERAAWNRYRKALDAAS